MPEKWKNEEGAIQSTPVEVVIPEKVTAKPNISWFTIGLQFGCGFMLAAFITGIFIGYVLAALGMDEILLRLFSF